MNRRNSIRTLFTATGALVVLPAWAKEWSSGDFTDTSTFTYNSQEVLASVADTIIPAGSSIGALTVGVDKFLLKLFENCYEKDVQDNLQLQLAALDRSAQSTYKTSFKDCSQSQRQELLLKFSNSEVKEEKAFFDLVKSETIRGFSTSKEVMLGHLKYKMVPGHYYGCVDVTT